ncbi:MAG: hypothetical protein ACI8RD_006327, partial [Bacillariaceae sp.]
RMNIVKGMHQLSHHCIQVKLIDIIFHDDYYALSAVVPVVLRLSSFCVVISKNFFVENLFSKRRKIALSRI